MKILFVSNWFPYPPINGAKIRIYNLIRELSKDNEITLLSFTRSSPIETGEKNIQQLGQYCRAVEVVQAKAYDPRITASLPGYWSRMPRSVWETNSPELAMHIDKKLRTEKFDVVVGSEVGAPAVVSLQVSRVKGVPKILDALEIGNYKKAYYDQTSLPRRIRNSLTWFKIKDFSKNILKQVNACTVPSSVEKQNFNQIVPRDLPVEIIPHALDLNYYKGSFGPQKAKLITFTGSFSFHANLDAVLFFVEQIYPKIKARFPDIHFQVIGDTQGHETRTLPADNTIIYTGLIKDVRSAIAQSWLSVVPLRIGAGTRLKIIESMAIGTPVVSTNIGAEGLDVIDGKNILIADNPTKFAQSVIELISDHSLHEKLSIEGRKLVTDKYSSEAMGQKFQSLLDRVI